MKSGKIVFPDEFQQLQRSRGTFDDEETYSDADADAADDDDDDEDADDKRIIPTDRHLENGDRASWQKGQSTLFFS